MHICCFFVTSLIAILDHYTVKYLIQMKVENDCNFYNNYPKRCCDWLAEKLEAFLKCRRWIPRFLFNVFLSIGKKLVYAKSPHSPSYPCKQYLEVWIIVEYYIHDYTISQCYIHQRESNPCQCVKNNIFFSCSMFLPISNTPKYWTVYAFKYIMGISIWHRFFSFRYTSRWGCPSFSLFRSQDIHSICHDAFQFYSFRPSALCPDNPTGVKNIP